MLFSDILGFITKYGFKYTKIISYIKEYFLALIEKGLIFLL